MVGSAPFSHADYSVAWLCALPLELAAASAMLDKTHGKIPQQSTTHINYTLGEIGSHNVVLTCLPSGVYGTTAATNVVTHLQGVFPGLRYGVVVGIGGGVPSQGVDVRLGDVVVSKPGGTSPGVVQYDLGKALAGGVFERVGTINQPPVVLLTAVSQLEAEQMRGEHSLIHRVVTETLARNPDMMGRFSGPSSVEDRLFRADYLHIEAGDCADCSGCDDSFLVHRPRKMSSGPVVHYGIIASGNRVIKDGVIRDELAGELRALCFEMEAAGVMNILPCLVIRGICDYCDSHKNKIWQGYAALTAASYAKVLISTIPAGQTGRGLYWSPEDIAINKRCLADLRPTDPSDDMMRIESTQDMLLRESYAWIFHHEAFDSWAKGPESQLVWIVGDPGKGKTMLLIGVIKELSKQLKEEDQRPGVFLAYFFCQGTDSRLRTATAVLRGVIYQLISQQQSLISYLRDKYDAAGSSLFEDANSFFSLSKVLLQILEDSGVKHVSLIVDGLDECDSRSQIVRLLRRIVGPSPSGCCVIKALVSSRHRTDIEELFQGETRLTKLDLENDAHDQVCRAVSTYIDHTVRGLAELKQYDPQLQNEVRRYIHDNSNGTFLWVALVCKQLADPRTRRWKTLTILKSFPPGLGEFYRRMVEHMRSQNDLDDFEICKQILTAVVLAYRPIRLEELVSIADLPGDLVSDQISLAEYVRLCGSFLTMRKNTIHVVHHSAKDYLSGNQDLGIFPGGVMDAHSQVLSRSLHAMSDILQQDVCGLKDPSYSYSSGDIFPDGRNVLLPISYACMHWIDHLGEIPPAVRPNAGLDDKGSVTLFLKAHFLHWLEALSLLRCVPSGIIRIKKLEGMLNSSCSPQLHAFVHDARRFVLYHRSMIEETPLQLYSSALVFSPSSSHVRKKFLPLVPELSIELPAMNNRHWSPLEQTLEQHQTRIRSVSVSPDGRKIVSGSEDGKIIVWEATTGAVEHEFDDSPAEVRSVIFLPDGSAIVSGLSDGNIQIWDLSVGRQTGGFRCAEGGRINSLAALPDSWLVSGSEDGVVRLWDLDGGYVRSFEGHSGLVRDVAVSPDRMKIASASSDGRLCIWSLVTGCMEQELGHSSWVSGVAFSPDGSKVVSSAGDHTVRLWDLRTKHVETLDGHAGWVFSVAFSTDGRKIASGSSDKTIIVWDVATRQAELVLEGHSNWVRSVTFSPQGKLVSGSRDKTVRIWDINSEHTQAREVDPVEFTRVALSPDASTLALASGRRILTYREGRSGMTLHGHTGDIRCLAFSVNGMLASGADDGEVRIWRPDTWKIEQTLGCHSRAVENVVFSDNGEEVFASSTGRKVIIYDIETGQKAKSLQGHSLLRGDNMALSTDGERAVVGAADNTVRIWEEKRTENIEEISVYRRENFVERTLIAHSGRVWAVALSPDGRTAVSGSSDCTVCVWDIATAAIKHRLKKHSDWVRSVVFLPDSNQVASGSDDGTVCIWNVETADIAQSLAGMSGQIKALALSRDGQQLVAGSSDGTIFVWDLNKRDIERTFKNPTGQARSVAISADGQKVASGSSLGTVYIWDAISGQLEHACHGHKTWVNSVAFSSDDRELTSASDDGCVYKWIVSTGQGEMMLQGPECRVFNVSLGPDGRRVAIGSERHTVQRWKWTAGCIEQTMEDDASVKKELSRRSLTGEKNLDIDESNRWVTRNGRKVIYLPLEFRPVDSASSADTLAFLTLSGRLILVKLGSPLTLGDRFSKLRL